MAKEENTNPFEDFFEENLLGDGDEEESSEEEGEESQEEDNSEEEEEDQKDEEEEESDKPDEDDEKEKDDESQDQEDEEESEEGNEEEEDPEQALNFWKEVDKINGTEIEVDYKGVDPLSTQGAALREQAIAEAAMSSFVENLKTQMPKVYQAFEHASAGGDLEELYKPGEKDYSKVEIAEDDEDSAKQIIEEYYRKKGVNNKSRLNKLVQVEEDSEEGIIKAAKGYLKELATEQASEREASIQQAKARQQKQIERDQQLLSSIDDKLAEGKVGNFVVPKKDGKQFFDHISGKIQRNGSDGYVLVQPLSDKDLEDQLKYEYFRYKKGDLSKLIEAKAKTQNAQRLKISAEKSKRKKKSTSAGTEKTSTGTLKDFETK